MSKALDIEAFVHAAADAIIGAGADGKIIFWNAAAALMFGFTAEEALGESLDLIIPERFRARHWTGYHQVMATGKTKYQSEVLRVPARHKEGQPLSIAFTVTLLDAPGAATVIVAIVRDETARWNEERELKRRLRDLEQRRS
jgi:PAS domain S-box-containing protein